MNNETETPQGKTLYLTGVMLSNSGGDFEHVYSEKPNADICNDGGFYYAFDSRGQWSMYSAADWRFKSCT